MSISFILEKSLKAQIISLLLTGTNRTAKQIYYEIKKKGISTTSRGIYKALKELLEQKVIIKYGTDYEINPEWLSELEKDSNTALKKLLEKNLLGKHVKDLKYLCNCKKGFVQGFCNICHEPVCNHCGFKTLQHTNCQAKCFNCKITQQEHTCTKCGKPVCLKCGKEIWTHERQFCKKQNNMNIGILEVDHDCWYSNISEKHPEQLMLNNFSDKQDTKLTTHSGLLKIQVTDKHKTIGKILKQEIIKQATIIHKAGKIYYIKTRAKINKSVDEFTQQNNSILLNPVIAIDSKEQNLILSKSKEAMKKLSKGLQEFGGKVRLVCKEEVNLNHLNKIQSTKIKEFLDKVPKKELLENLQKVRF